ncbi:torsin-like protein isoform X2 [Homalodisca vitripennis]|uniref:torsin-like protein isoform X2 n=1 Tax=Homalodisca vitripennis TaxID=197043 RepID=UPI001EECD069|nr:torsin-like protein isoform X2 [Homalodisca vitripennis]
MLFYKLNVLSVLLYCFYTVNCLVDPLSLGLLGATISTLYLWLSSEDRSNFGCKLFKYVGQKIGYCEGCEDYWITDNLNDLEYEMKSSVYGQPLAVDIIMSAMRNHLRRDVEPDRALMLSFHGSPGTGKNFIAQMILKNMFRMGAKSEYTIFFRSSIDFPLKSKIDEYKRDIVQRIKDKVYECHRSIFVFDEVEKMPNGLLEVLSGVVTIGVHREYDFRKSIFILLSNIGSDILVRETLKEVRLSGNRENMEAARLHRLLAAVSFNSEGGFKKSGLVKRFGISHYVPFLPLESDHVIQCLVREVVGLGQVISNELINLRGVSPLADGQPRLDFSGNTTVVKICSTVFNFNSYRGWCDRH